ncbi:MAG: hypothetical protein IJF37_03475 [Lachnospiraceae bacterium]|nr:hypothetical protein [Lachnospiraceae bacterium]
MEKLNKTRAFLTEFIIVILFFSIAAVITIGLYVESDKKDDESVLLAKVSLQAQSIAENIRSGQSVYDSEGIYTEFLDENMNIVAEEEAAYEQKVMVSKVNDEKVTAGNLYEFDIIYVDMITEEDIYSVTLNQYSSGEVQ